MIRNDVELKGTQERIAFFILLVANMRQVETPESFKYMASGYLLELEKMHTEVMEYLRRHASEPAPAEAVGKTVESVTDPNPHIVGTHAEYDQIDVETYEGN
jgi:hypothetical protein